MEDKAKIKYEDLS